MSPVAKKNLQVRPANPSERGTIVASFMNRPTFFGLAFAATALLLVSASDASANKTAAVSTEGVAPAETPTAPVQPPPATPVVPAPSAPTGGATSGTTTPPAATTPATGQTTTPARHLAGHRERDPADRD